MFIDLFVKLDVLLLPQANKVRILGPLQVLLIGGNVCLNLLLLAIASV